MNTLRLFLVGRSSGPGVADIMEILGKEEVSTTDQQRNRPFGLTIIYNYGNYWNGI